MANQLRLQRMYHKRILRLRTIQFWWYPILCVILGGAIAAALGEFALDLPKEVFGIVIGVPLIFVAVRYPEFGFLLFAVLVSPFMPSAIKVSTMYISPAVPLIFLLFFVILIRTAFHVKKYVLPSFWTIWPLLGLILMALISEALIQVTWVPNVPHRVLTNPIIMEEGVGILIYTFPLLTVFTATNTLTGKAKWVEYIQYAYILLALLDAIIILVEFKRIGADVFAFRYSSPSIGWIPLEAMAQLLVLGCILSYARFLYATRWKTRILFGLALVICLLALYFSLENSWWLEAGVGLAIMTLVYSRRLFVLFCVAA
ncbi:MAG TPA: hypothetical protein VJ761_14005, partial [Ktedonobacteraceae bacterium]|nr:hypothetical protein [Ktedonobacteraceae bacterium]